MKGTGANQPVNLARRETAELNRRAPSLEESARRRDGYFVARADRNDAGHKLLERGGEAVIGQFEQRGSGKRTHRGPDTAYHLVNIKIVIANSARMRRLEVAFH